MCTFGVENHSDCVALLQVTIVVTKNVHQALNRSILRLDVESSFTLREQHHVSSSWLWFVSLMRYKDGTRTIEMILVSTVLPLIENFLGHHLSGFSLHAVDKFCPASKLQEIYI